MMMVLQFRFQTVKFSIASKHTYLVALIGVVEYYLYWQDAGCRKAECRLARPWIKEELFMFTVINGRAWDMCNNSVLNPLKRGDSYVTGFNIQKL